MTEQRLEMLIGNLLRTGVLLSAAVVALGAAFYLGQHRSQPVSYAQFKGEQPELRTIVGIMQSARHGNSEGLMQFGLLLLIATPIARVVLAVVGFYLERDHLYVLISLIVLSILGFSLLHAT